MYPIPVYQQIVQTILTELTNQTGQNYPSDSDAAIRAQGTAAVVEGLYAQQSYIARQLFVHTADEEGLYLHAQRLDLARIGGTLATGQIAVNSTQNIELPTGALFTDGLGHYYQTNQAQLLNIGLNTVQITAQNVGLVFNAVGYLSIVSPIAGVLPQAQILALSGGSDGEDLESWRSRLLEKQSLGQSQGRDADFILAAKSVGGVFGAYPFSRRRGLGSYDVAITATGQNDYAALPSAALLAQVQAAIESAGVANADVRAFAPVAKPIDIVATVAGVQVNVQAVQQVIIDYMQRLTPNDDYKPAVLSSIILDVANVSDVQLSPSVNIQPTANWMMVEWLRMGTLTVHV